MELDIALISIPETESEYFLIPLPNATRLYPKVPMSLSPVNKLTMPPVFGIELAKSVKALPAVAAFTMEFVSIPLTATLKAFIAKPNRIS